MHLPDPVGFNTKMKKKKIFGMELLLNLYNCNLGIMKSKSKLLEFPIKLCQLLKMNRCGKPIIRKTGKGDLKGYSMVQFIETSSITVHTCDPIRETYINVFSCKTFEAKRVTDFIKRFFQPEKITRKLVIR